MSKSKINPLITASVMSAVCLAGLSNVSLAVDLSNSVADVSLSAETYQDNNSVLPAANALGQRRYIVRFKEPAVARYSGNGQFAAIPRRADNKIEVNSSAVTSYVNHLKQQQNTFLTDLSSQFGRQVNALLSYQYSINGFAVNLTAEEAAIVMQNSAVDTVRMDRNYFLNTDAGPTLIGANNIWNGVAPASGTALGEGIVIGTLDTGMNFDHPSFADVGGDAYDHTNPLGSGNYVGVCDPSNVDQYIDTYVCNDKLIGGFDFINALVPDDGSFDIPGPEDENGHGSHTASTSGGNVVLTAVANGVPDIAISGVAPHATIIHFDVCFNSVSPGGCAGASSIASVDQAIADGLVDVINYSISGGNSPWADDVSLAFLSATDSGIYVSASAGNSGPGAGTLGHVEPWTSSMGASTHDREFVNLLSITGPVIDPTVQDIVYNTSNGPAAAGVIAAGIQYSGEVDAANVEGCVAFPASSFDGLVALISRGSCAFADKVANATAAGAIAVVIHNNVAGGLNMDVGAATTIPSFSIDQVDGDAMAAYIAVNAGSTVQIDLPVLTNTGQADVMAGFSSRGPSPFEYNKPDITGPGVNILAAFNDDTVAPSPDEEYGVISGTSMSSPHNAGSAALLKELHPTWSAPEIKSALMLTAVTAGVTKEDGVTPADPYDRGAGRIQVDVASSTGLVMNETAFKFLLADPANGGDPKTLNTASYKNDNCIGTCSFQRKFTSVAAGPVTYDASLSGMPGTVNPANFTANPGQTVTLDVEIDGGALVPGATSFGELQIVAQATPTPFVVNPSVAITDNGYTSPTVGTTGMVCEDIIVSGLDNAPFVTDTVLSISHNDWLADLTLKLVNPGGDVLTLLNESSAGSGITLDSSIPISFFDGAAASADTLGSDGGAFGGDPACTFDPCEFFPFANAEATPPATFADLSVGDPNGTWQICAGDSAGGDTGILESATLNLGQSTIPNLHMPLVVVGLPEAPDITVNPLSLSATLDADMTTDLNLNISNSGLAGADLNWSFGAGAISIEYLNQDDDTITTGFQAGQYTPDGDIGAYTADDFTSTSEVSIETMQFDGFVTTNLALNTVATSVNVHIYADDSGVPMGHPEDGLGLELVSLNIPIADGSLDLTDNSIGIDVVAANGGPIVLPAGTYWVTVFPTQSVGGADDGRWIWFAAGEDPAGSTTQLVSPTLFGIPDWAPLPSLLGPPNNVLFEQMSIVLAGSGTCGASWISTAPSSGVVVPGGDVDVTVTLDSTGLTPGVYSATLCVDSDDLDEPQILVPVTMTVDGPSDLIYKDGFEGAP